MICDSQIFFHFPCKHETKLWIISINYLNEKICFLNLTEKFNSWIVYYNCMWKKLIELIDKFCGLPIYLISFWYSLGHWLYRYSSSLLALKSNLHRLQFILKFNNIHPFIRHFINHYSIAIDKVTIPIFCYRSFRFGTCVYLFNNANK